eukprot:2300956-Lingulodinium_polyedra.AAC.1
MAGKARARVDGAADAFGDLYFFRREAGVRTDARQVSRVCNTDADPAAGRAPSRFDWALGTVA